MRLTFPLVVAALAIAAPVDAQSGSGILSQLGGGGLGGGGLGGLVPGVGSAGIGNVAGLLGYCVKNQLLGSIGAGGAGASGGASNVLGALTGKRGVTQSDGYLAGRQGVLQSGTKALSLGSLGDGIKQQVCKSVLGRAQVLAGR